MPPKRVQNAPAKKKTGADPTFGMKNKKGKKAQEIQRQMQNTKTKQDIQREGNAQARKEAKEAKKQAEFENQLLFRPVVEKQKPQVVPAGVDPKSVLCMYFKKGHCQYGDACRLSHDLNVENKSAKRDMFSDGREDTIVDGVKVDGTMEDWDQDTLVKLVTKKAATRPSNASEKVCKFFLKAIEKKNWGWFWVCPNGGDKCPYRHALPPGFVLVDKNAPKEKVDVRPLEEILEEERAKIITGTKVTPESFAIWKVKVTKQKEEDLIKAGQLRLKQIKSGEKRATGRELLSEAPERYIDDGTKGEEDVDVLSLLKQKQTEEEEMDKENARLAVELNEAVEKELKERELERLAEEEAAKANGIPPTDGNTETTTPITTEVPEALQNVDKSLFTGEDLPDDFSDDDQ